jgi:pyridoxamine 5'-phosphate oxidase family protein
VSSVHTSASGASAAGEAVAFTDEEVAYLRSHGIARLATLGDEEQPDVVPVADEFDGT